MVAGAPVLSVLDLVPKALTVEHPLWGVLGSEYQGIQDTSAPRIVLDIAGSLIEQFLACAIGGGSDDGLTVGSGDDFGREAELRHNHAPPPLLRCGARSEEHT